MKHVKLPRKISELVRDQFPSSDVVEILGRHTLWAGYGYVYQLKLSCGTQIAVKFVEPPTNVRPDDISNARKLRSYQVELFFYDHLSHTLTNIAFPKPMRCRTESQNTYVLFSDLTPEFPKRLHEFDTPQLCAALSWLAEFHAQFWNYPNSHRGVWKEGCYWHLSTRRKEWKQIPPEYKALKDHAEFIDGKVHDGRFLTLIHGDTKADNIFWNDNLDKCAFFDFQYVGQGLGARDVAYLICSSASSSSLCDIDEILHHYFSRLVSASHASNADLNGYKLYMFQEHFDWALLDYVRFMAGWGFWGNSEWAIARTEHLIS